MFCGQGSTQLKDASSKECPQKNEKEGIPAVDAGSLVGAEDSYVEDATVGFGCGVLSGRGTSKLKMGLPVGSALNSPAQVVYP